MQKTKVSKKVISAMIMFSFVLISFSSGISSSFDTQYDTQAYPTAVTLEGLTDTWNVTWSGNSSSATPPVPVKTYCNSSGIRNTTMIVNLTVNSTHVIEWINVSVGNLKNTTNGWLHNASNITLWISGDNATWEILQYDVGYGNGRFPDGGGNLTINDTIWGVFGFNPWWYHGDAGVITNNCSIYLRFQCDLTFGMNYGYYYNESTWTVYIGEDADTHDSKDFTGQLRNGLEPMGCCLDVNKTVWNNDTGTWSKQYTPSSGDNAKFNISFHNCGDTLTDNISIYDTHYDAIRYYVPSSATIKYLGSAPVPISPNATSWENASCGYSGHGHITWHIPKENLTTFTYCNYIYIEYEMSVNSSNYSKNEVGVYVCPFEYEWCDADCYDTSECYVNEEFDTSIICNYVSPEASNWSLSEHINRPCVGNGCYDEEWFDYETNYDRWCAYNDSTQWEWVYRYDNGDGNGTDALGLSYTIANRSDTNRSMSLLRTRYNISDYEEMMVEPCVGIIYSYTNNSCFDMALYGYDELYLLSKEGSQLVNTYDSTVVTNKSTAYNYYSNAWPKNTSITPYYLDPSTMFDYWNGIWIKTIYNGQSSHLQTKAWQIDNTHQFGLDYEPPGWTMDIPLATRETFCFGLAVWNPDNTTKFYADFDFIEEWRLNYSRDEQANASQLENHSVYGSDGIPLITFPTHPYFPDQQNMWDDYYNTCYEEEYKGNLTGQQFADCTTCFYQNLSRFYSMESRAFNKTSVAMPEQDNQEDNIYYYSTIMTNLTYEAPYNNSMYIQIEECTDGEEDSYDGAVVAIDIDNNLVWDDNDMAFYWFTKGTDVWYTVYSGTVCIYYDKVSSWDPDMNIWFGIDFTNTSYGWYDESSSLLPPVHRYSPHRVYHINIPLYYLEKGSVGSGDYLNVNETFGLHIMTTDNDYSASPVWENWNETDESYYIGNGNNADSTWTNYMNCTDRNECIAFEEGMWNGVTETQMQYWAHGRILNNSGTLEETTYVINATKIANISTITNMAIDNLVNYTVTICNNGDLTVTDVIVNDTFPSGVVYIGSSLSSVNVTNPYDNCYIFNLTDSLLTGNCLSFNITVNFTAGCGFNGSVLINYANASTDENATAGANHSMQYGTNTAPRITAYNPVYDRSGTSLLLVGINATVEDDDADAMNVYFITTKTSTWSGAWNSMGTNTSVNNGTYQCNQTFNNSARYNTKWRWGNTEYYWYVNLTDGKIWVNESYTFTTDHSRYDIETDGDVDIFDVIDVFNWYTHTPSMLWYDGFYDLEGDGDVDIFDCIDVYNDYS